MRGVAGVGRRWLETDSTENVPPRLEPVIFGIRFTRERAEAHRLTPNTRIEATSVPKARRRLPHAPPNTTSRYFWVGYCLGVYLGMLGFHLWGTSVTPEDVLADCAVDAPIGVDHLRHAEIGTDRHQRNRLIFAHSMHRHQKPA